MTETKRQLVHAMSIHAKSVPTPAQVRPAALAALIASQVSVKTIEEAKNILSTLNQVHPDHLGARWYREYGFRSNEWITLLREYRKAVK